MADLDDFFAKKDRSKKTKVKKFASPDELAKKLEDTSKKNEVKSRSKEPLSSSSVQSATQSDGVEIESGDQVNAAVTTTTTSAAAAAAAPTPAAAAPVVEEDEWRDFEEERGKDYTGLKIQNIELNDDDYYSGSDGDGGEGDGEDGDSERGAWKKMQAPEGGAGGASAKSSSSKTADAADPAKKAGLSSSSTGRYVSPALRNQQTLLPVRLKKDALPDISNEELFPTLGDAKKEELRKKKNEPAFEEVRSGARFQRSSDLPTNAPVSIGNRYNSLADS